MAYLKPQTPLKDLNSGDYFYPLTTIDQIITGNNRLSAFLNESNNLLNLNNIGNINVNGHVYAKADNDFISHGNEFNFIPDGFNADIYLNYDTITRKNNGTVQAYRFCDGKHNLLITLRNSIASTWLDGQKAAAIDLSNATNTGSYWPWIRQTNTSSSKYFSFGILDNSFYWVGSAISRTNNGYDHGMRFDVSNGLLELEQGYFTSKLRVATTRNGYALNAASFICDDWIRTVGNTGWYNETYGGGIYMVDSTWVRTYNGKNFYCSATMGSGAHLYTDGYFRCSGASYTYGDMYVGSNNKVHFWEDGEGGNIQIIAPNGKEVQMDMYNSQDFRIYSWNDAGAYVGISMRRSDGHFFANAVHSAVWNDYAEYRESDTNEPGYVVFENGDDTLSKTIKRLQHFAGIISDTFGFCEGETEKAKTPLAVAGRVLAYPYRDRNEYKPGDCLCAAPNGTVDIMTREEVCKYPDRIVGTVSCVPTYEEWGGGKNVDRKSVKVNGRIWVHVR